MYCSGVEVCMQLLGWVVGSIRWPRRFDVAEAQVLFEKLICLQYSPQLRLQTTIAIIGVRMELLGFLAKSCGDIGKRTPEVRTQDRVGVHRVVHRARSLRQIPAPAASGF